MGNTVVTCLLIYTIMFFNTSWCSCKGNSPNNSTLRCRPSERAALLNFKHITNFDKDVSSSWEGEECCSWRRVGCDNTTGHIVKLDLNGDETNVFLNTEKLDSLVYLLELKQLESLDLSFNDFNYSPIPRFMGSMKQLRYLNLSFAFIGGLVPYELGNLTNLRVLDLGYRNDITVDNLGWVTSLRGLRFLNMNFVDMSFAHDWMELLIGPLPYVRELHLSSCGLTFYKAVHKNSSLAARLPIHYLDLSGNSFSGEILPILQNLTSLEHLDVSTSISLTQSDLHDNKILNIDSMSLWGLVHNLCTLRSLDLSRNNLRGNFLQPRRNLSNICRNHYDLEELSITQSSLIGDIPGWLGEEFRSLKSIDLSVNTLSSEIPASLGKLSALRVLDLSANMLLGEIPASLGKLPALRALDLSANMLSGEIPASFGKLTHLEELDLHQNNLSSIASSLRFPINLESLLLNNNQLSGKIPTSIGKLSKLQTLDISSNQFEGAVLSEPHFAYLSNLTDINMDDTLLTLNLSSDWVPPFQLHTFYADTCKINGQFPPWLQTQKNLTSLILSNSNISGFMPRWFHTMQQLDYVYLSNNKLRGSPIFPINFNIIDLSNNLLSGDFLSNDSKTDVYDNADCIYLANNFIAGMLPESLGHIMPYLGVIVLANNQISGAIPGSFCQLTSLFQLDIQNNRLSGVIPSCLVNMEILILSNNQIEGPIPESLCQGTSLQTLDIGKNRLSGVIPNCWSNVSSIYLVNLSNNKLKGHIPCFNNRESFGPFYLHLNDNMLGGEIPSCLSNLTNLHVLDIGGNRLSGKIPKWFNAEKFTELKILRLRDNKFSGSITRQLCFLPHLQLMDLGYNHFTGSIPRCLSNLTAMTSPDTSPDVSLGDASEVVQGIERAYTSTLRYLVDIDLSCNNLVGSIPDDMTKISGLLSLNLSYNQLSGTIPENIGGLKNLISLDLSKNKLRGSIPTSIGEIYTLSHLNLSYNNLSGQIPSGNQLQTLSDQASIYAGNPYLCGDFLLKKCKSKADKQDKGTSDKGNGDNGEKLKKMGFVLVVMSGFATGFWGVVGCLVVNRRWRLAFFRRVEDGYNWLYVLVALKVRAAKAKINRR